MQPTATPVEITRATVISLLAPFGDDRREAAERWLASAGREQLLAADLGIIRGAQIAARVVIGDADLPLVAPSQLLVARIGFGAGEQVADGRWSAAVELPLDSVQAGPGRGRGRRGRGRRARRAALEPQARLAAILGQRLPLLVCEELTLRARTDLDNGRHRAAALGLTVALESALVELPREPTGPAGTTTDLRARITELRAAQPQVAAAAAVAAGAEPDLDMLTAVRTALEQLEAALRARTVARGG